MRILKRVISGIAAVFICVITLIGCAAKTTETENSTIPGKSESEVIHEDKSVKIIREMMKLDTASMTVSDFNTEIQQLCQDSGTTVFEVISDAYDHFGVYNDDGQFMYYMFSDDELETFIQTTLSYSSQEIFGEPVHMGSVSYMTMPNMTAAQMAQKEAEMPTDEWEQYFTENIADIQIFPVLSYEIETEIQDPETFLISERDDRINNAKTAIADFILGLTIDEVSEDNLEQRIQAEFEIIPAAGSDEKFAVACRIQSLERDVR